MKTSLLGDIGRAKVIAEAMMRGMMVSVPFSEDCRYDLIVDRNGSLERVQVKTTTSDGETVVVKCRSTSSWSSKTRSTHRYTSEDIEWLVTYDITTDACYFVPATELGGGRTQLRLRLAPTRNGQRQGIRWASDYRSWERKP